jgi:hypothetical protein
VRPEPVTVWAVREVIDQLDRLGIRYFVTGSEAGACYGVLRQTYDIDIVVDLQPGGFARLQPSFMNGFAIADEVDYDAFSMASVISTETAEKADLIFRRPSPWAMSAMDRRRRVDHATLGSVWISSVEDLILAKLVWSEGTSELQLRDCGILIRSNRPTIDWPYLERWALVLGVGPLLDTVRDAP